MKSKEFLLEKFEKKIKRAFYDECYIRLHLVHVLVYDTSSMVEDLDMIEVRIPALCIVFPTVLVMVEGLQLLSISVTDDRNFMRFVYLCK